MSIKARIITLLLLAGIVTALGACGKKDEPVGPPPECMTDSDCGPYKACRAAKCIVVQTPENLAGNALKLAKEELEKSDVNYEKVLELYDEAHKHVPNIENMDFNIALIYVKMRRFEQAMPKIDMLLEKDPTNEELILAKGKIYMMQGEEAKALEFFQKQADANPDSLNVRNNIATIYRQRKDWDNALKYIRQIFMLDPAHAGAFNNLGLIYLAQDKILLARMVTANGIQAQENTKRPKDAGLYNNLGLIYLKMGEKDRAVANFRTAFKIDKTLMAANLNLGHIAVAGRDWKHAREHYQRVLAEDPQNLEATLGLAQALRGYGELKKSEKLYLKVLKEQPENPYALFSLGALYCDHLYDKKKADEQFKHFLALNLDDEKHNTQAKNFIEFFECKKVEVIEEKRPTPPPVSPKTEAPPEEGQPPAEGEATPEGEQPPAEAAPAEAPAEQPPAEAVPAEAPAEQPPAEAAPVETPAEQPPAEAAPAEAPAEQPPAEAVPAEAPAEQPPAEAVPAEAPAEQPPAEAAPAEAPAEQPPAEAAPAEAPAEQPPAEAAPAEAPAEQPPAEAAPVETPAEQPPAEAAPAEAPAEQPPAEATPAEAPAEQPPAEAAPAEVAPVEAPAAE